MTTSISIIPFEDAQSLKIQDMHARTQLRRTLLDSRAARVQYLINEMQQIRAKGAHLSKQDRLRGFDLPYSGVTHLFSVSHPNHDNIRLILDLEMPLIAEGDFSLFSDLIDTDTGIFYYFAKEAIDHLWPRQLGHLQKLHDVLFKHVVGKPSVLSSKKELRHDIRGLFLNNINIPNPNPHFLSSKIEGFFQYKRPQYVELVHAYLNVQTQEYRDTCKWLVAMYPSHWVSRNGFYVSYVDNPSLELLVRAYAHGHADGDYLDPRLAAQFPNLERTVKSAMDAADSILLEVSKMQDLRSLRRQVIMDHVGLAKTIDVDFELN